MLSLYTCMWIFRFAGDTFSAVSLQTWKPVFNIEIEVIYSHAWRKWSLYTFLSLVCFCLFKANLLLYNEWELHNSSHFLPATARKHYDCGKKRDEISIRKTEPLETPIDFYALYSIKKIRGSLLSMNNFFGC